MKEAVKVWPRGIGLEYELPCFVTKTPAQHLLTNISMFVPTKEDGEKVVEMFDGFARLDYRPKEPNWIQVKVGICNDKYLFALQRLLALIEDAKGYISKEMIQDARNSVLEK
jgi:hypothetical protein